MNICFGVALAGIDLVDIEKAALSVCSPAGSCGNP
jgi:hypothetical protein